MTVRHFVPLVSWRDHWDKRDTLPPASDSQHSHSTACRIRVGSGALQEPFSDSSLGYISGIGKKNDPEKLKRPGPNTNSVQFSRSVVSNSFWPHGLQCSRLPCPSPTHGAYSNSCPLSRWCHPTISSSVVLFASCPQSFPASGSFPMSQFFTSGGQSIGASASASVLPINIQDWFPLGWTGWISLQSKGLSRVFSNTTVQKHQFFATQLSL